MKRSNSADRAPRPQDILPFNNSLPARPTLRSSSLGRDVRCGCQFFGTDSLLPEKQALMMLGRPKAKSTMSSPKSTRSSRMLLSNTSDISAVKRRAILNSARSFSSDAGDHEYEPVSLPPPTVRVTGPYDRYEPELGTAPREGSNSSTESRERKERKFLRRPLDDELVGLPVDGEGSEEETLDVEEKEEMDNRDIAAPSPGTTSGSRTDLELNTSQVDSSALEDLPLSREGRRQQRLRQMEERGPSAAARSLQRIRSEAGKLRTKLRSIKRPNINMPERPRFSMPERPKFNFPDRPKFNLPERPKFNLPERPKFNLPERPKFNFPQRPKFNMPERPKFNMPERPKFNMPERPKFNFPSFSMPRSGLRRTLRETNQNEHIDTPAPSTPGKRNYFDFRTYPRIFDRKTRQHREMNISAPTQARHITPPNINYDDDEDMDMEDMEDDIPVRKPQLPPRRKNSVNSRASDGQRWVGKFTELDYVDSENVRPPVRTNGVPAPFYDDEDDEEMKALERELMQTSGRRSSDEEHSESISGFRDKDFGYAVSLGPGKLPKLPPQVPPQTMMVDPYDEDIGDIESFQESEHEAAHSSGSSSDRRRAGVLEEIDSDEFFLREKGLSQEDVAVGRYLASEKREAFRPAPDNNIILLENATLNEAELARSYRGTPERATAPNNKTRPPRRTRAARQRSSPNAAPEPVADHYFNTFPPNKPTRNRRRMIRAQERVKKDRSSTMGRPIPPLPPKRKKTTRSEAVLDTTSQWSEDLNNDWLKNVEDQILPVQVTVQKNEKSDDHEYIIPEAPAAPAAPKRGRRQSRQTPDDDSRSHISHVSRVSHLSEQEDPGYACVIKPGVIEIEIVDAPCTPPPRRVKTLPRPPFPSIRRRRNRPLSGSNQHPHFSTVPHRRGPPTRPCRNYATLGPSRPPRKQRIGSMDDVHDRSLQSGAVIQKMKERPLPPPPRPPRRERESESIVGDELQAEMKELMQDAPMAAGEDIDGNVTPVQRMETSIEKTENDDIKVYEDSPTEEHVIQHVIQLASEVIHTQKEIIPESNMSKITEPEVVKSEFNEIEEAKSEIIEPEVIKSEVTEPEISQIAVSGSELAEITQDIKTETPSHYIEAEFSLQETSEIPVEIIHEISVSEQNFEPPLQISEIVKNEVISEAREVISVAPEVTVVHEESVPEIKETTVHISQVSMEINEPVKIQESYKSEVPMEMSEPIKEIVTEEVSTQASMQSTEVAVQSTQEEMYIPVEEVSVSTQTDPIPEEELIRLELEAEELASRPKERTPAPVLPPPPQVIQQQVQLCPEVSPAIAALLEALSSGQLKLEILDVGKLNVNEVQAQRLMVSDIDGLQLKINELQSQAGTLVLNSVDAPLGSLAEALMTAAQQLVPPPAPLPPPLPAVQSYSTGTQVSEPSTPYREMSISSSSAVTENTQSIPVNENISSFSSFMDSEPSTSTSEPSQKIKETLTSSSSQPTTLSRSRQSSPYPSAPVFTTEQVVALQAAALSNANRDSSVPPPLPPRRSSSSVAGITTYQQEPMRQQQYQELEPGISELGSRLCRACCTATLSALRRVMTYSERQINNAAEETRERSGLQVALCMVLVLVAGLIIVASFGGSSANPIHHHHWDFYMPQ